MKTVAVIPCYNERKHIEGVVATTQKYVDKVVVADGGSTDGSQEIARAAGAKVVLMDSNSVSGYGATLQRGIRWVKENTNSKIIVLLDGDGQHDPNEIPRMLAPIVEDGHADVVMGCRIVGNGMPAYRRFGNRILSAICNVGASWRPIDAVTGYWAIRRDAMPLLTENKWGLAVELLIKCRANGYRMAGVPVRAIYHETYEDNSSVGPVHLALSLLWLILKWRWRCEVMRKGG